MAAGVGSRYGGLKQIDQFGPSGETMIDYSAHDAVRAGFGKIVFIIRRDIEQPFKLMIGRTVSRHVEVEYAYQDLADLPDGFSVPPGREKPWGTGHAILACRNLVKEPFGVVNADDFYGPDAYQVLADQLRRTDPESDEFCLVAYVLRNTLSDNGTVTRGVCEIKDDKLIQVTERHKIEAQNGKARYLENGDWNELTGDEAASMNMWGFTPKVFDQLLNRFPAFLESASGNGKAEFLIPTLVDDFIQTGDATVHALHTDAQWLGVTYPEDKETVSAGLQALVETGMYGKSVWDDVPKIETNKH
jgi:NDP-sugar pyrophosphorylase family protein